MLVSVLHGPNLNLLGSRRPEIYGRETLADVEAECHRAATELKLEMVFHQSNREYEIIDWVHEARDRAGGIVINPAAFTHTSVAILDALKGLVRSFFLTRCAENWNWSLRCCLLRRWLGYRWTI